MATLEFTKLWDNHPGRAANPCDTTYFPNQCAIRMGIALQGAGANLGSFRGAVCYPRSEAWSQTCLEGSRTGELAQDPDEPRGDCGHP